MTRVPLPVLRLAEAGLTAAAGAALGGVVGRLGGPPFAVVAGVSAGLNGAIGGHRQVYDWRTGRGWFAFLTDSTWGLVGTSLGNLANLANLPARRAGYRADLSRRRNRHVFERGVRLRRQFAVTYGNVVSNASIGRGSLGPEWLSLIDRHEELHIWQSRLFGPVFQLVYALWSAAGVVVGTATWIVKRERPGLWRLIETAAYYHNPFEYWAYKRDGRWEANRAEPTLKWRRLAWLAERARGTAGSVAAAGEAR